MVKNSPDPGRSHMPWSNQSPPATTTKACMPRDCAPKQEKPPEWEAHGPQLESSSDSLQLEKSNEDPAQPKIYKNFKSCCIFCCFNQEDKSLKKFFLIFSNPFPHFLLVVGVLETNIGQSGFKPRETKMLSYLVTNSRNSSFCVEDTTLLRLSLFPWW